MEWLTNNYEMIFMLIGVVVSAVTMVMAVIAPLTKSDLDNKILDALRWVQDKLLSPFSLKKNYDKESP